MDEIFKQYGAAIVAVISIILIITVVSLLMGDSSKGGAVYDAFSRLMTDFFNKAETAAKITH